MTIPVVRYRLQRPPAQSVVSIQPCSCHSLPFVGWQRPDENVGGDDVVCGETWRRRRRRRLPSSSYYFRLTTCFLDFLRREISQSVESVVLSPTSETNLADEEVDRERTPLFHPLWPTLYPLPRKESLHTTHSTTIFCSDIFSFFFPRLLLF